MLLELIDVNIIQPFGVTTLQSSHIDLLLLPLPLVLLLLLPPRLLPLLLRRFRLLDDMIWIAVCLGNYGVGLTSTEWKETVGSASKRSSKSKKGGGKKKRQKK